MIGNVIFMYSYYKDSGEKVPTFYIMKTFVATTGTIYEINETGSFPNIINDQELNAESIKWFQEKFAKEYSHINNFKYHFVEIEISDDFNAAAITCPEREDWEVAPNLYPSNRP